MKSNVPLADAYESQEEFLALEKRRLEAAVREEENRNKVIEQRISLRKRAVSVTCIVMVAMGCAFLYMTYLFVSKSPVGSSQVYVIVALIAPIASVTSLTIALLWGAFRGYKETDGDKVFGAAAEAAKQGNSMFD